MAGGVEEPRKKGGGREGGREAEAQGGDRLFSPA